MNDDYLLQMRLTLPNGERIAYETRISLEIPLPYFSHVLREAAEEGADEMSNLVLESYKDKKEGECKLINAVARAAQYEEQGWRVNEPPTSP